MIVNRDCSLITVTIVVLMRAVEAAARAIDSCAGRCTANPDNQPAMVCRANLRELPFDVHLVNQCEQRQPTGVGAANRLRRDAIEESRWARQSAQLVSVSCGPIVRLTNQESAIRMTVQ